MSGFRHSNDDMYIKVKMQTDKIKPDGVHAMVLRETMLPEASP